MRGTRSRRRARPTPSIGHLADQVGPPEAHAGGGFAGLIESANQPILAVTYWFEPDPNRKSHPVAVRFSGRRVGVSGKPQPRDQFVQDEFISDVVAGSGPIAITARVKGINPGAWNVTAQMLVPRVTERLARGRPMQVPATQPLHPAAWSARKWSLSIAPASPVETCLAPFARVPGVILGFYPAMVTLGVVGALIFQAQVIARDHLEIDHALAFTIFTIALGFAGAKAWFVVIHRKEKRVEGWCIQGVLAGICLAAVVGLVVFRLRVGNFLDASTPGVLFAMAIGRTGCFFGGCCAGRATASRWGLWSSLDQRIGMRRIPTQFIELVVDLVIGLVALVVVLNHGPFNGAIFVAAVSTYTLLRQPILRLRAEMGKSSLGPQLTAAIAAISLAADGLIVAYAGGVHAG